MNNLKEIAGKDTIEIIKQSEVSKKANLLGSEPFKRGLTLFEYNCETKEIYKAVFTEEYWNPITKTGKRKVVVNPNCVYKQFLNEKSARKGFGKLF